MKTNMIKIASVTLAMALSISLSAQNTKSLKENNFTSILSSMVRTNFKNASHELANQINNIKAAIQYKPESNFEYIPVTAENNAIDLSELELIVKFSPDINLSEPLATENNLTTALDELKAIVKYQPVSNENGAIMNEIAQELAVIVKYNP